MNKKKMMRKDVKILLVFFLFLYLILSFSFIVNGTFAKFISAAQNNGLLKVANFSFVLKKQDNTNLTDSFVYDLEDTVTTNDDISKTGIVPGKAGEFVFIIDMSGTEVDTAYDVYLSTSDVMPDNLKFYSDDQYANEVTLGTTPIITGVIPLSAINTPQTVKLYWRWAWVESDTENDFEAQNLDFNLKVNARQYVG